VTAAADIAPTEARRVEQRTMAVACGAHALHDGYTDLVIVMLPVWQAEFALSYAAVGALRAVLAGTMASFQIPAAALSARLGTPLVLAGGTALAGLGYGLAMFAGSFPALIAILFVVGLGASTQHPLGSSLIAHAFSGPRSLRALGTYNFAGDIGKMAVPAAGALMVTMLPWRTTLAIMGVAGLLVAVAVLAFAPRSPVQSARAADDAGAAPRGRGGFYALLAIAIIDTATRMGLLTFLPFLLTAKGASLPTIGFALTLVFVGGAVGKLACAWIGARIGVVATVWLTEGLTALGILALLAAPLAFALALLPLIGIALNGTSSVLYGSVPLLVAPHERTRAFSIFYTGAIGSGAVAPILYGFVGDAIGIPQALVVVAGIVVVTLPLVFAIRRQVGAALDAA
jgi:MFS family permease